VLAADRPTLPVTEPRQREEGVAIAFSGPAGEQVGNNGRPGVQD